MQDGVLIQSSGRGGEASTSGKGAAAAAKGRVAYVGAEPTDAELLKSRVAEDGAARQCRFAALLVIGMLYMYSTEAYPSGNVCKIIHLIVPHLQHSSFDCAQCLQTLSFLLTMHALEGFSQLLYVWGRKRKPEEDEAGAAQVSELPLENGPLSDGPTLGQRLEALQLRNQQVGGILESS